MMEKMNVKKGDQYMFSPEQQQDALNYLNDTPKKIKDLGNQILDILIKITKLEI